MEAPVIRGEMHRPAAYHLAVLDGLLSLHRFAGCFAERIGLLGRIVGESVSEHHCDFIVFEVFFVAPWALLQRDHAKSGGCEFFCHYAARGSNSYHDEVHRIVWM